MGDPWLSIVGMPHDSAAQLPPASRAAIDAAEVIFGGPRHLELAGARERGRAWPVPFAIDPVLEVRGRQVVVLASGDPFWFGAGGSLSSHLAPGEWRVLPAASTFSLVAGALGWRLEDVTCHGLHAAPIAQLRGVLAPRRRMICLVRDGAAPAELARWLTAEGAGAARLTVCERMGGAEQRMRETTAAMFDIADISAPVAVAVALPEDVGLPRSSGLPDDLFANDGQITKRPVRALTLSALGPRPGETLWDIGAGSGSISVEWCLAGGRAEAFEKHAARVENIASNADRFGIAHRLAVHHGDAAGMIGDRTAPDAVFVGGGGSDALFDSLFSQLPGGTRLVANGVTLETEARFARLQAEKGGSLLRIELAEAAPLGRMRGWQPLRPVVQWSVTL
ncbi:cobalamin biosynthesis bifunctional protein CbiET [Sulfitobacter alexandrii]|uniref:Cobalamin biosynthesis bifunctional protein CbiET n=1 Tax=Sulfitobacter alexandrii TaxID=1917485 RepID=A0A1J0WKT6_9RHOB|nr:precorrin-6y C5,15-methyltransferase (decarboxylating) subunit CbiE [Sulfitobacter alexandrii]APE44948.1 cobalamin biosynthesis bifunctional protein CbiET [Sulfitobacter alexandrii]